MQWKGLYNEKNPTEIRGEHLTRKKTEGERAQHHSVNTTLLFINKKPILGLARGGAYIKLSFFSIILTALVLLVLSL